MFTLFKKWGKGTGLGKAVQRAGSLILNGFGKLRAGIPAQGFALKLPFLLLIYP